MLGSEKGQTKKKSKSTWCAIPSYLILEDVQTIYSKTKQTDGGLETRGGGGADYGGARGNCWAWRRCSLLLTLWFYRCIHVKTYQIIHIYIFIVFQLYFNTTFKNANLRTTKLKSISFVHLSFEPSTATETVITMFSLQS